MARIIQITDIHLCEPNVLLYDEVDTTAHLNVSIDTINRIDPDIDAVLITGDLVDAPTPALYEYFKEIISRIKWPVYLLAGNHDNPALMKDAFGQTSAFSPTSPTYQYSVDCGDVQVLMLNSHLANSEFAAYGENCLAWLSGALSKSNKPTLLAIHHPPMTTDIELVDMGGATWFENLGVVVARHEHVKLIISGHGHTNVTGSIGGVPIYMSASQAHQLECARGQKIAPSFIATTAPPVLHSYTARTGFQSGPCPWPSDADAVRIDKKAGLSWTELKNNIIGEFSR